MIMMKKLKKVKNFKKKLKKKAFRNSKLKKAKR